MAGNYPDYISNRMAYHIDGTVGMVWRLGGGPPTVLSGGQMWTLNNEEDDSVSVDGIAGYTSTDPVYYLALVFPEPRNISAFFSAQTYGGTAAGSATRLCEVSTDTTNGIDGTWTSITGETWDWSQTNVLPTAYRLDGAGLTNHNDVTAVRGMRWITYRFGGSQTIAWSQKAIHLFGRITSPSSRLELWHPTLDQRISPGDLDWGNAPRSTQDTRNFRIKNVSTTETANTITVSIIDSTDSSPSFTDTMDLSQGAGFAPTQTIGNLSPGATSGVLTVRRTFSSTQALSVWAAIIKAEAVSWS